MSTLLPPTSIYTIIIGGFFILVLARRLFCILARCIESPRLHMWLYQHLESHIIRRTNLTPPVSRRDLLLQCLYWVGTGCYNFIGASTTQEVSDRAIVATAFNTMPLLLGDRLDLAAQILTFSRRTYQNIHSTVGLMTVVQMVLHIILQQMTRRLDFGTSKDCYRLIAVVSLSCMALTSIPVVRRLFFEAFAFTHLSMTAALVYSLWMFTEPDTIPRLFLYISIGLFSTLTLYRITRMFGSNLSWQLSKGGIKSTFSEVISGRDDNSVVELKIHLARPMSVRCGQFIYVWIPGLSLFSFMQQHPFSIAWWDCDPGSTDPNRAVALSVVIRAQQGITAKLARVAHSQGGPHLLTAVDGPYGNAIDTSNYGTLVLIASGIGVAAVMSIVKNAVEQHRGWRSHVHSIVLAWHVDTYEQYKINKSFMDELLKDEDTKAILKATIYVSDGSDKTRCISWGTRVEEQWGKLDLAEILKEPSERPGRALLCVSAYTAVREQIGILCRGRYAGAFEIKELDFQPDPSDVSFRGAMSTDRQAGTQDIETAQA